MRHKLKYKIILACVSSLFVLVAVEFGLRLKRAYWEHHHKTLGLWVKVLKKSNDPILVYEGAPNAEATGLDGLHAVMNSQGCRDDEFPSDPPPGTPRILVLGDSVAWGWGLPMEDAFPQVLEKQLKAKSAPGQPPPIVYNYAVVGYSTKQELRLLEARGLAMRPNLIVLNYVLNDPDVVDGGLSRYFTEPPIQILRVLRAVGYKLKRLVFQFRRSSRDYCQFVHERYKDDIEKNFKRLGEISKDNNVPILVAVTPIFEFKSEAPYAWQNINDWIKTLSEKNHLEFLDLHSGFASLNSSDVNLDDVHPNQKGHQIIADELAEWIEKRPEWIPSAKK